MNGNNTALIISKNDEFVVQYTTLLKLAQFRNVRNVEIDKWEKQVGNYPFDLCILDNTDGKFQYEKFIPFVENFAPHAFIINVGHRPEEELAQTGNFFFTGENGEDIELTSFLININHFLKRAKSRLELAAMLIHDIRSPLNSLIAYIELLLNQTFGKLNEGQYNFLEKAMVLGDQTLDMLEDINEIYRNEQYVFSLDLETFSIHKVLDQALVGLWIQADSKEIQIKKSIPEDFPPVQGDAFQIQRVFTNLIGNAIRYCPRHSTITIKGTIYSQNQVKLSIIDNGEGIPEEELKKIFNRYYRYEDGGGATGGTGLGLYICKLIVKSHRGKIWAEKNEFGGSSFHFTLPISK
ncbi:MAG: sensor histidine kinase [Calditrichaeota bacterium]|nr:MAG: sensor histidine kinase [Calditrichota bacterium]